MAAREQLSAKQLCSIGLLTLLVPSILSAQTIAPFTQSFSDVPPRHAAYQAVEYLKKQGILLGYNDGTFRPDQNVTRAEALKIIVAPLVEPSALTSITTTTFTDIATGVWYLPFAEAARQNKVIDGPPVSQRFNGGRTVNLAEFLKMLFLAYRLDPASLGNDMTLALSSDVRNAQDWYYPHIRLAIASSTISVDNDGKLMPSRELTRGSAAGLLHAFLLSQEGKRFESQLALTEMEIGIIERMIQAQNLPEAEYAAARALLVSRGALASAPKEPLALGLVQTAQSFWLVTVALRAGTEQRFQESIDAAGEAWRIAETLPGIVPSLEHVKLRLQAMAKAIADQARTLQANR